MNMNTLGLGVAIGLVAGAVPTFFITKNYITKTVQAQADADIREVTQRFEKLHKVGEYADPSTLAQSLGYDTADTEDETYEQASRAFHDAVDEINEASAVEVEGVEPPADVPTPLEVVKKAPERRNLFEKAADLEANISQEEIEARTAERPYIITAEEWADHSTGWDKVTMTWWADKVMSDDQEKPVETDLEDLVGLAHLELFGTYSRDEDIVYVRNEKNDVEFEIVRDPRTYIQMMNEV